MWALHHATQVTAVVWVRSTSGGALTITCNGASFSGSVIDTAVDDGCGACEVTGLSAGSSYVFVAFVAGIQVAVGTLRTLPANGDTYTIAFGTCVSYLREPLALLAIRDQYPDLAGMCWLGDNIYSSEPTTGNTVNVNGEALTGVERVAPTNEALTKAQLYRHYRGYWQQSATQKIHHAVPNWFVGDDHDHQVGNDWDGTITSANNVFSWALTQQEVDDMETWCNAAFRAYTKGNPNWPNFYFSVRVNDALEMFFVDGVAYRDAIGSDGTLLGAAQKAWLTAGISASTATFKVVMSGKNFWGGADDFAHYDTERNEIRTFINTWATWAVPGGLIWCSGDIHYPYIAFQDTAPMVNVCSSPLGTWYNTSVADGYAGNKLWKSSGYTSVGATDVNCYPAIALLTVVGSERLDIRLVDYLGATRWQGSVMAGEQSLSYNRQALG